MLVQLGLPTRLKLHVMNWMAYKVGSCTRSGSKFYDGGMFVLVQLGLPARLKLHVMNWMAYTRA